MTTRFPRVESLVAPYLIKKALDNDRSFDCFHPSAWGSCLRKIAYQYYNSKNKFLSRSTTDIDIRYERIFDNGHGMHHRWQNYLDNSMVLRGYWRCTNPICKKVYGTENKLGIFNPLKTDKSFICCCGNKETLQYEEIEVVSDKCYNFQGHVDAVIDTTNVNKKDDNSREIFVIDFKSIKSDYFFDLEQAKWEHIIQIHIYMWLLDLKFGIVLYENKDTQAIKEMVVPKNESIINEIKAESSWLLNVIKQYRLPEKPSGYTLSKSPCWFCEFSHFCYGC